MDARRVCRLTAVVLLVALLGHAAVSVIAHGGPWGDHGHEMRTVGMDALPGPSPVMDAVTSVEALVEAVSCMPIEAAPTGALALVVLTTLIAILVPPRVPVLGLSWPTSLVPRPPPARRRRALLRVYVL